MRPVTGARTEHQTCGLRFERSEAKKLRNFIDLARADDLKADIALYEGAAEAAERGEPLIVLFEKIEEVVLMVAMFVEKGFKQPVIEELSG